MTSTFPPCCQEYTIACTDPPFLHTLTLSLSILTYQPPHTSIYNESTNQPTFDHYLATSGPAGRCGKDFRVRGSRRSQHFERGSPHRLRGGAPDLLLPQVLLPTLHAAPVHPADSGVHQMGKVAKVAKFGRSGSSCRSGNKQQQVQVVKVAINGYCGNTWQKWQKWQFLAKVAISGKGAHSRKKWQMWQNDNNSKNSKNCKNCKTRQKQCAWAPAERVSGSDTTVSVSLRFIQRGGPGMPWTETSESWEASWAHAARWRTCREWISRPRWP